MATPTKRPDVLKSIAIHPFVFDVRHVVSHRIAVKPGMFEKGSPALLAISLIALPALFA
jgi:hypothetical protein